MKNRKLLCVLLLFSGVSIALSFWADFSFDISKVSQTIKPATLTKDSSFKYSDLSAPIKVMRKVGTGYSIIETEFNLSNGESYSFSKVLIDIHMKCTDYITFEYKSDTNLIQANTTPGGADNYTPEKLTNCLDYTISAVSEGYETRNTLLTSENLWK